MVRLIDYTKSKDIDKHDRIFPISDVTAWQIVKKAGWMVNIELRPHDLRWPAATFASRFQPPLEIVSKVILRYADLSTTQRYLGKIDDTKTIRQVETLYG